MDTLQAAFSAAESSYHAAVKTVASRGTGALVASPSGIWNTANSLTKAQEQYRHYNGWAFCAIRAVAQRLAAQDIFVANLNRRPSGKKAMGDELEPLDSHPLLDAIDDPNPLMVRWSLMVSTVASLELCGRSFWWLPEEDGRVEIWPLPANWVTPVDPMRGSWLVRPKAAPEGFEVPSEEMAYFYLPDPSDPFGATSPLQSQAPAVATDEALQTSQYRGFKNGLFPDLLVRAGRLPGLLPGTPGSLPTLSESQRRELAAAIKKACQGAVNYGEPLILDALIEGVDRLSNTPREMDWLDSGMAVKSRILQAFGVNPLILGEIQGANRAQAYVAEEGFAKNVCNPLAELMSQVMTQWVGPRFARGKEKLAVWIDPVVPHDDELSLRQWEVGLRFGAVDRNEFRVRVLNLAESAEFSGPADLLGQLVRNSVAKPAPGDVGTREPDLIHTWQFDRIANGNGHRVDS